jgi:hypothetical protein
MSRLRRLIAALGLVGLALVDVGNLSWTNGLTGLTNGLWTMPPSHIFHLGLYLAYGAMIFLLVFGSD